MFILHEVTEVNKTIKIYNSKSKSYLDPRLVVAYDLRELDYNRLSLDRTAVILYSQVIHDIRSRI